MTAEEARVAGWSVEEHLAFDIGFALPRAPVKGLRRALTKDERRLMAKAPGATLRPTALAKRPPVVPASGLLGSDAWLSPSSCRPAHGSKIRTG
jgi:hypothetical protein